MKIDGPLPPAKDYLRSRTSLSGLAEVVFRIRGRWLLDHTFLVRSYISVKAMSHDNDNNIVDIIVDDGF